MIYDVHRIKVICKALKEDKPWDSKLVAQIKNEIKTHKLEKQRSLCCYCLRDLKSEIRMVIDLDHVLPKSIYTNCFFDLENLAASCKRCNMHIKRARVDHIKFDLKYKYGFMKHMYFKSENYLIIHPFCDFYLDHMYIKEERKKYIHIRKYECETKKGKYTYDFFRLKEFEIDSINLSQGINTELLLDDRKLDLERDVSALFESAGIPIMMKKI